MTTSSVRATLPAADSIVERCVRVFRMPGAVTLMYLRDGLPVETWSILDANYTEEKRLSWEAYVRGQETGRAADMPSPGTVYLVK